MWILGTDTVTNKRYAFPMFSSLVTFDVSDSVDQLRRNIEKLEGQREQLTGIANLFQKVQAMESKIVTDESDIDRKLEEQERQKQVKQDVDRQIDELKKKMQRMATAEAVVVFSNNEFVVRATQVASSWDDVQAYTRSSK